jgi:hypothetical protein
MFGAGGWTMIFGILLGLSVILGSVYFVFKMFIGNVQDILVRFILLVFTALTALFIVDKVIAWKVKLLPDEMNNQLFDLIKTLVLMIFSYYFGTKSDTSKSDKSNHI